MIVGEVSPFREAVIRLTLRGTGGREEEVETALDAGFTDFLALPLAVIRSLGLQPASTYRVALADGTEVNMDTYMAEEVKLWVVDGGSVIIERLP